jgi:hypothetical protein
MADVTSLLGDFRKDINAVMKAVKEKPAPKADPADPAADPTDPPADPAAPPIKKVDPAQNTELQQLQRQVKTLTDLTKTLTQERETERTQRLESERTTAIKDVLAGIPFRDEAARNLFYNGVANSIKRDAEGNLVAETKDGPVMFDAFIKSQAEQATYLLQPQGAGGAGARGGKPGQQSGPSTPQIEDITPTKLASMKPEEKQALYKQIESAAREAFSGAGAQ